LKPPQGAWKSVPAWTRDNRSALSERAHTSTVPSSELKEQEQE